MPMISWNDSIRHIRSFFLALSALLMLFVLHPADANAAKQRKAVAPKAAATAAVTISAPASGATVSGTVAITAQIGSGVSWINVYIDGSYLASSPPLMFSWDSTTVLNGSHSIS